MFLRISHPRVNKTFLCLFVYCCLIGRHTSQTHKSCLILCDSMYCSPPGSSVHGIFQAKILEWVAISFSRGSSSPRDWTCVSCRKALLIYKSAVFLPRDSLSSFQTYDCCDFLGPVTKFKFWFYVHVFCNC